MQKLTKDQRRIKLLERKLSSAEELKSDYKNMWDHWMGIADKNAKELIDKIRNTERDFEILRKDVNGYKSEVERQKQIILNLEAQIGRLCIQKGIVR